MTNLRTLTETAGKKLEDVRDQTGGALHAAASSVRKTARQSSEVIDKLAAGAADGLDATASYVDTHFRRGRFPALRRFGRHHLTESLVVAAAIGFFAGVALSRRG